MFILTQQGQAPVDVDVQSHGDPNVKTEDLEQQRKEIISLSGIPAPYLGYQDVVELRESLSSANISFATDIIDMQESFNASINDVIDKVAKLKGFSYKPSSHAQTFLIPPVVLILQLIESTLSSIGNIAGVFQNMDMDIDPYYLLQQYVPQIDWNKFREFAQKYSNAEQARKDLGGGEDQQGGPSW